MPNRAEQAQPVAHPHRDEVVVLCHGGFRPHRGLEQLVDSVALMDPNVRLILRGFGPSEKDLRARAERSPAGDRISFEEPVPMSEVVHAASGADIGVIPYLPVDMNHTLCSPNKLFEYLQAGLAIVASDLVELRRVIQSEGIGALYDPYSPEDLAHAINTLARDPVKLSMAKARAASARDRYRWDCDAVKLLEMYEHFADEGVPSPRRDVAPSQPLAAVQSAPGRRGGLRDAVRGVARRSRSEVSENGATRKPKRPRLLVTITAFPVMGGMRSVLLQVQPVLEERYEVHYLTRTAGAEADQFRVHTFGRPSASYFRFPGCISYTWDGLKALLRLQREHRFDAFMAQDILYTGLFTSIVGRLTFTRTIVMDHGSALVAVSPAFQKAFTTRSTAPRGAAPSRKSRQHGVSRQFRQFLTGRFEALRPRVYDRLMPRIAWATARLCPEFLVDGDELVGVLREGLGVPPRRIREFPHTVDVHAFRPRCGDDRQAVRERFSLPNDAVVIAMVNRLVKLKGLETAVPAIAQVIRQVDRSTILVIAGDGPDRSFVERLIDEHGIRDRTRLLGELGRNDVAELLGASDIFVYAGMQGTGTSLAILEGMSSACAVVATDVPASNVDLLADERGLVVSAGDTGQMRDAVREFVENERARQEAGMAARRHILSHHSRSALQSALKHI